MRSYRYLIEKDHSDLDKSRIRSKINFDPAPETYYLIKIIENLFELLYSVIIFRLNPLND
jgi:hypothetical protein